MSVEVREMKNGVLADEAAWQKAAGPAGATRSPTSPPSPVPPEGVRIIALQKGTPGARATLLTRKDLSKAPGVTGMIAHYAATDPEAAVALLGEAARRLRAGGADRVVGPMDGSTWHRYRLALPVPGGSPPTPPFLTEPVNPDDYPAHFEAAGFRPVEMYVSRLVPLDALERRVEGVAKRLEREGIRIEALDPSRFEAALDEIHALSLAAFAENPYYGPIGRSEFRALYEPVRSFLVPELVLLARGGRPDGGPDGELLGFVFGFPDLLDPAAATTGRPTRVVAKSMAVLPSARGAGLGSLLLHEFNRRAAEAGFSAVMHALMHVENASHRISRHGGDVYREYALYGWQG